MSDYVGGGVTLLVIVAAIVGVLFLGGGGGGTGEASIIPEAVAATPIEADYGWKAPMSAGADADGQVGEFY